MYPRLYIYVFREHKDTVLVSCCYYYSCGVGFINVVQPKYS